MSNDEPINWQTLPSTEVRNLALYAKTFSVRKAAQQEMTRRRDEQQRAELARQETPIGLAQEGDE